MRHVIGHISFGARGTPFVVAFELVLLSAVYALKGASVGRPVRGGRSNPRYGFRLSTAGKANMRSETPAHQPQGSKRARDADLQGARSGATRLDTPTASMNRDAGSGSGPATDRVRRRLEEAWY